MSRRARLLATLRASRSRRSPDRDRDRGSIAPIPSRRARTRWERARDRLTAGDPEAIATADALDLEDRRG